MYSNIVWLYKTLKFEFSSIKQELENIRLKCKALKQELEDPRKYSSHPDSIASNFDLDPWEWTVHELYNPLSLFRIVDRELSERQKLLISLRCIHLNVIVILSNIHWYIPECIPGQKFRTYCCETKHFRGS